ncbi:phospholipase D-like domain-containing protein [Spirosoma lituiforme]
MMDSIHQGSVIFFNQEKGFGFITSDLGEVFLLKQFLRDTSEATNLRDGISVQFTVVTGKHKATGADQLVARNVQIVADSRLSESQSPAIPSALLEAVPDSDQPLRKHGLGLARELIRQNGQVFNKKLVKALAHGLGSIETDEQYNRAKQLLAGNQKAEGLQWAKLSATLFNQANNIFKLQLWLDGHHPTCDAILIENAYLKGDTANKEAILARCMPEQQQQLKTLPAVVQMNAVPTNAGVEVHFSGIRDVILAEISGAKTRIRVAVAWLTSHYLFDALCQRVKDGLEVELIILNDPINNWTEGLSFQEFIELGKVNGNSRLYFSNVGDRLLHHKFCVIDDAVLLNGSYNWTYYAEGRNTENCMVFKGHPALIEQFNQEFTRLTKKLEQVEVVIPFDASFSPALDMHRVGAYRSNDVLAHAKELRRTNRAQAAILIRQALKLNPENEEAKRLQPKPVRQSEQMIRDAGIQSSLDLIAEGRQKLQMEKAAEEAQTQKREQEATERAEAQKREHLVQMQKLEAEKQQRLAEDSRLREERAVLEAKEQREKVENKRLAEIAEQERGLKAENERIAQEKRVNEEKAKQEHAAQEQQQREEQKKIAAAVAARAKADQELAEKAAALKASKGTVLQGNRGGLRINLEWKTFDDLDLHVYDPDENHIYYSTKEATCQDSVGKLDVDANAGEPLTKTPQENIFWDSNPPEGTYKVEVQNYSIRELDDCPFVLTLIPTVGEAKVLAGKTIGLKTPANVIEFKYSKATGIRVVNSI